VNDTGQQVKPNRKRLIEALYRGYGDSRYASGRIRSMRVRMMIFNRMLVIGSTPRFKRAMDIFISVAALLLLCPLFLVVALIIRIQDGGPALFWQTRVGLWGREFQFPKFRSMVTNAEQQKMKLLAENHHGDGVTFKIKCDPRITQFGAVIRKLSIDELPQFWCVLTGEMSLVGPRPPLPSEVARYAVRDRRRLEVKPGLTCIWQISGRSELPFEQQVRLDAKYIDTHSNLLDVLLLLKTIPAIISGRGAY
jgi:lipopolysaccharide/colanic/teichoic acid biosynthesis glycosyltransferase